MITIQHAIAKARELLQALLERRQELHAQHVQGGEFGVAMEEHAAAWLLRELSAAEAGPPWTVGNGSELPLGTEAWIAWKARDGYDVTWSYRREGGWGSDHNERSSLEEPAFADEPGILGLHAPIVFYMLKAKPAPPALKEAT